MQALKMYTLFCFLHNTVELILCANSAITFNDEKVNLTSTYNGPVYGGGGGATGGGYLHTMVITSSPSISRLGWNRTTMLLVNTRVGF